MDEYTEIHSMFKIKKIYSYEYKFEKVTRIERKTKLGNVREHWNWNKNFLSLGNNALCLLRFQLLVSI